MQSNTITSLKGEEKTGIVPQNKSYYCRDSSIECNKVGIDMKDKTNYIQKIEHINGFKVVMTCPEMTKDEYLEKEQIIVDTILKCLLEDKKTKLTD